LTLEEDPGDYTVEDTGGKVDGHHIDVYMPDELGKDDYTACREHGIGSQGMIWKLVISTSGRG
jgi:3D (Asp-Asp-Asp) domain-containing protein